MSGITVILPAFNEEVAIGSVVLETKRYADYVEQGEGRDAEDRLRVAEVLWIYQSLSSRY